MPLRQLQITSDAHGDDRAPIAIDAQAVFGVLDYLDEIPEEVRAAASPDIATPIDRAQIEAALSGPGIAAVELRALAVRLRNAAFEDTSRGEVPVETDGDREPDFVNAVASMLEHLAWFAGDLGRIRAMRDEEVAA